MKIKRKIGIFAAMFIVFAFSAMGCANDTQVERCMYLPTFTLRTISARYADYEIDVRKIQRIISGRHDNRWDWMVLEPVEPIQYSTFMQVGSPLTGSQYSIEIGFGDAETGFRLYRLYAHRSVAIQHMVAYWQEGIIPDISSWEDRAHILQPVEIRP